jgi:multiple sugar transport system permease protein
VATQTYDRQNPAFFAVIALLIFMSVGPVLLLLANSLKLDVDITSGVGSLLFMPTIRNYETALCDILWYEPEHLRFCQIRFGGAFINSIIITLVSTVLTLVMG